jgi:hypothetical protein
MLYCTAAILYGALSITLNKTARTSLAISLSGVILVVSITHFFIGDVETFRRTFLVMLLSVFFQCVWLLSARVPDAKVRRQSQYLALYGTGKLLSELTYQEVVNESSMLIGNRNFCFWLPVVEHRCETL